MSVSLPFLVAAPIFVVYIIGMIGTVAMAGEEDHCKHGVAQGKCVCSLMHADCTWAQKSLRHRVHPPPSVQMSSSLPFEWDAEETDSPVACRRLLWELWSQARSA